MPSDGCVVRRHGAKVLVGLPVVCSFLRLLLLRTGGFPAYGTSSLMKSTWDFRAALRRSRSGHILEAEEPDAICDEKVLRIGHVSRAE